MSEPTQIGRLYIVPVPQKYLPHQGVKECAKRRMRELQKQFDRCVKQTKGMPAWAQVDYGYVDGMQELDEQITRLFHIVREREPGNVPRRVWVLDCYPFGPYESSKRRQLAKLRFYTHLGCKLVMHP